MIPAARAGLADRLAIHQAANVLLVHGIWLLASGGLPGAMHSKDHLCIPCGDLDPVARHRADLVDGAQLVSQVYDIPKAFEVSEGR